jgi:membrane protein
MDLLPRAVSSKQFLSDLKNEIADDNVFNGAAALAYYLTLAIFPALIFILSLVPLIPVQNIDQAIMDLLRQALPSDAAGVLSRVVQDVLDHRSGGLVSFAALGTLWAASAGMYAVMQQLNITYDVKEGRSFPKGRLIALGLTVLLGVLVLGSFFLVVLGGHIQDWIGRAIGYSQVLLTLFAALRWAIIGTALLLAFAVAYYFGPDVKQRFKFITPGSVLGTVLLAAGSLGFRLYISKFSDYSATYGSIGAVIVLMLWFYLAGLVLLLGSEINALIEHYSDEGKAKGEKAAREAA